MTNICVRAFVTGKVQGVWFRQSTKEQALKQGVTGWAKNLSDGRVEVLLCGEKTAVANVQQWLHEGPELARVDDVVADELGYQSVENFVTA
ncbi:MAG: acylphosphatase [Pseudomonadales bacterium]